MPTKDKKIVGQDDKKEQLIRNQWRDFSKTAAYAELMKYADIHQEMLLQNAQNLSIMVDGKKITIDGEMANFLLQRRAGVDIIKTYIRLYVE